MVHSLRAVTGLSAFCWLLGCGVGTDGTPPGPTATGGAGAEPGGSAGTATGAGNGGVDGGRAGGAGAGGTASLGAGSSGAAGSPGGAGSSGGAPAGGAAGQGSGGAPGTGGAAGAVGGGVGEGGDAGAAGGLGGTGASSGTSNGGASAGKGGSAGAGGAADGSITVWLAGDSTVANGNTPCPAGWGKSFDALFDDRVTVTNSAVGGRSVRTWLYNVGTTMDSTGECTLARDSMGNPTLQSRWQQMLSGMQPGDYLFIQFGINDASATCDRHVGTSAFASSYGMMAEAAKARGAQPVFVTPVSAVACNGSTARATRGAYVTTTVQAGMTYDVPVIDLHALSIALYTQRGFCPIPGGDVSAGTTGPVGDFFCDDHTHFSAQGATAIAALVGEAVREQGLGLAAYLK